METTPVTVIHSNGVTSKISCSDSTPSTSNGPTIINNNNNSSSNSNLNNNNDSDSSSPIPNHYHNNGMDAVSDDLVLDGKISPSSVDAVDDDGYGGLITNNGLEPTPSTSSVYDVVDMNDGGIIMTESTQNSSTSGNNGITNSSNIMEADGTYLHQVEDIGQQQQQQQQQYATTNGVLFSSSPSSPVSTPPSPPLCAVPPHRVSPPAQSGPGGGQQGVGSQLHSPGGNSSPGSAAGGAYNMGANSSGGGAAPPPTCVPASPNHCASPPGSYPSSNASHSGGSGTHSRGDSPGDGGGGSGGGSSSNGGQHVVHVYINPGETFSVRLGDQIQYIQGE